MITDLQQYIEDINELPNLKATRYENIFQIAKNNDYYFYNILKSIKLPQTLNSQLYTKKRISSRMPYTTLSYQIYGTQDLWWLLCLTNNIKNPVQNIEPGTEIIILKQDVVSTILKQIKSQIKN